MKDIYEAAPFGEALVQIIERYADRIAIVCEGEEITYREMGRRVSRYCQALKSLGLNRGDALTQISSNRPDILLVNIACAILGVRITLLHPKGSEDDHAFVLQDCEATVLIADERRYAQRAEALSKRAPNLKAVLSYDPDPQFASLNELAQRFEPQRLVVEANPDDIVQISYTGGTTGRSKGVIVRSRTRLEQIKISVMHWEWPSEVRMLAVTPVTHAAGATFYPTLFVGGAFYIVDGFDPAGFLADIEKHRITMASLIPTMLYVILDLPNLRDFDTSSLEVMLYGAAPMSPARLGEGIERFGKVFLQYYGQAEAPMVATILARGEHDLGKPDRLGACGRATIGTQIKLLNEDGVEVPRGEIGEICIRGNLVSEGYWKRPEENEQLWRMGWLHTGDLARMDDEGFIFIVDRSKDMIISGGFNVYPREVEDALTQHAAVMTAAVIGIPDPKWGEAVKALVVLRTNAVATPDELIQWVREKKGPVYAPKTVEFLISLPLTGLGKPDKKALRAQYWTQSERQIG